MQALLGEYIIYWLYREDDEGDGDDDEGDGYDKSDGEGDDHADNDDGDNDDGGDDTWHVMHDTPLSFLALSDMCRIQNSERSE